MPAEKAPSRASEIRRSTKPIMEKRRRARINNSLTELKNLILDALKKDNARHSKLEKADILEMTVKHLQSLQQHRSTPPEPLSKYRAGFSECAGEVSRYLAREGVDPLVQQRLMTHLSSCLSKPVHQPVHVQVTPVQSSGPVNLSQKDQQPSALQVVGTTRLPSSGIAFLLPPSPYSTSSSSSSCPDSGSTVSALSPVSVLGSSGILSPACSERSTPSPVLSCGRSSFQPIPEPVWRPW